MRRDGHLSERVCGYIQRDAAGGFSEQLLSAEGGVSGEIDVYPEGLNAS